MDLYRILSGRDLRWSISDGGLVVIETPRKVSKTGKPLKQKRYDRKTVYRTIVTYFSWDGEVLQGLIEVDQWLAEHPKENYAERRTGAIVEFIEAVKEKVRHKTQSN